MNNFVMPLMLALDTPSLTMSLINIASTTGAEVALADSVEAALGTVAHLDVERVGDTVIARTVAGHAERVMVAAHLDTGSADEDPLAYVEMGKLFGPGASDAKGALAVALKAAAVGGYRCDVTFVFYAGGLASGWTSPGGDLLRADFALLAEPTDAVVRGSALDHPWAQRLIELTEVDPSPGADGAHGLEQFDSLNIPAVAFGPGDPSVAGTAGEFVPTAQLTQCEFVLREWLSVSPRRPVSD